MNTGPFCIIHAVEVLPSGLLGDNRSEFWDFQISATRLPPYWRPSNWAQVVEGDECLLGERQGTVASVDRAARRAVLHVAGDSVVVARLAELRVPVARVERRAV